MQSDEARTRSVAGPRNPEERRVLLLVKDLTVEFAKWGNAAHQAAAERTSEWWSNEGFKASEEQALQWLKRHRVLLRRNERLRAELDDERREQLEQDL